MRTSRTPLLILLAIGVPFGLLTAVVAALVAGSASAGAAIGLAAGLVFGGIMALIIGGVDAVADRAPAGARRGPRQDTTVPLQPGADLSDRIVAALQALPANIREVDVWAGRYHARTGWSWKSYGEDVTVQLTGDPSAPWAVISSRPVLPTTLVDYGKGRANVAAVAGALTGPRQPTA